MIEKQIANIFLKNCALDENITENSKLEDLSMDSLSFVRAIVEVEQKFNIEFDIDQAEISYWEKIGDILKFVESKLNEKL